MKTLAPERTFLRRDNLLDTGRSRFSQLRQRRSAGFRGFRPWFYAAAIYNLIWGSITILFPGFFFQAMEIVQPNYPALWQVTGMFVLVYALGYYWAARKPYEFRHLILLGTIGKICGPLGFVWSVASGTLPPAFGWTIITNDLVWLPVFILFLHRATRAQGGWRKLLEGGR